MLVLQRDDQNAQRTLGTLSDESGVLAQTLELPWLDNKPGLSCIPAGTYFANLLYSPVHGRKVYWLTGVKGRVDVEIHWGNFARNTKGCILLGTAREANAIDNSVAAFEAFMTHMAGAPKIAIQINDPA
jgi:hypothetical protein